MSKVCCRVLSSRVICLMPNRERSLRTDAIVLRHSDWSEADRLLVLCTQEKGKLKAIAKGAKKLTSRKAGHLEPLTHVHVQLARGKDLWIVTQVETRQIFNRIREDLILTAKGVYLLELTDRFTFEDEVNAGVFRLLADSLTRLDEGHNSAIVLRYFEIHMMDLLGYRPQLFQCVRTGEKIQPEDQFFSAEQGGVICPRCAVSGGEMKRVNMNTLKYTRHLQRCTYTEIKDIQLAEPVLNELEALMQYYLTYLLERRLNTTQFLRSLQQTHDESTA